jgi:uncharacterized protein (DUF58 family)
MGEQKKPRGEEHSNRIGYDSDMISIRDYLTGDPMKYISWKSTAKTGALKTKEFSTLEFQPVIIEFDKVNIRDLELKISCVTFMILRLFRAGVPFGLAMEGEVYGPNHSKANKMNILRRLALYDQS